MAQPNVPPVQDTGMFSEAPQPNQQQSWPETEPPVWPEEEFPTWPDADGPSWPDMNAGWPMLPAQPTSWPEQGEGTIAHSGNAMGHANRAARVNTGLHPMVWVSFPIY